MVVERAIARLDYKDALARTIARAMNRSPIPAELMAAQFPWCDLEIAASLVALAEGERGARLLELAEHGRFAEDHVGFALRTLALHAAWILDGAALRERITTQLHRLVTRWRAPSGAYVSELIGELARVLGEPSIARGHDDSVILHDLAALRWALSTPRGHVLRMILEALDHERSAEPAESLMKWKPAIVHAGPKVGRNEPCPCGSGKKYKRCHGGMEHGMPLTPSTLTADEVLAMPLDKVELIDRSALADAPLCAL